MTQIKLSPMNPERTNMNANRKEVLTDVSSLTCLIALFLFSTAGYILNPYFAIIVAEDLGHGIAFAGLLISIKVVTQRLFSLLGGIGADVFGSYQMMQFGVMLRIISFLLLAFSLSHLYLIVATVLNGIGSACFNPAIRKTLFTKYKNNEAKLQIVISLRSALFNVGTAIGPLIGMLFIRSNFMIVCFIIAALHLIVSVGLFLIKREEPLTNKKEHGFVKTSLLIFDRQLLPLYLLQFCFIYFYSNLEYLIPIYFSKISGTQLVGFAFFVNAVVVVSIQVFFVKWLANIKVRSSIAAFMVFFLLMFSIQFIDTPYNLIFISLLAIFVFSFAEAALAYKTDYLATKISDASGAVYGALTMVGGLAFIVANLINGLLQGVMSFQYVWGANAILSIVVIAILLIFFNLKTGSKPTI